MNVLIAYYTGTGGTKRAAEFFSTAFEKRGWQTETLRIKQDRAGRIFLDPLISFDWLLLLYPVHSFNAPSLVFRWLDGMETGRGRKAAVISVSGGGEMFPNTACRHEVIKLLENKNYSVVYENMLVLPPNCLIKTPSPVASALVFELPKRIFEMADELERGVTRRIRTKALDRMASHWGKSYEKGAKGFGAKLLVSEACTACEDCINACPAGNIFFEKGKIRFGNQCQACLSCVYRCPVKAITPGAWKSFVLKEGYDLTSWSESALKADSHSLDKLAKGILWAGVRRYLNHS